LVENSSISEPKGPNAIKGHRVVTEPGGTVTSGDGLFVKTDKFSPDCSTDKTDVIAGAGGVKLYYSEYVSPRRHSRFENQRPPPLPSDPWRKKAPGGGDPRRSPASSFHPSTVWTAGRTTPPSVFIPHLAYMARGGTRSCTCTTFTTLIMSANE